jgi:4-hydroxyphenylacetate 3-monooxygenase/4-hydroxybutyryl-CoA dehydratase/vinylacetyl-CoA-Delta-isomerase
MKTAADYFASLARMKHSVFMGGRKLERPYEDPQIRTGAAVIALTYELAGRSENEELMTATSHLSGKRINRFTHIHRSADDLRRKIQMTREYCRRTLCIQRCMGVDALNALSIITHQVDQLARTSYHKRFNEFLEYFQDNDLTGNAAMTDVKGDRSLRPHQQADPDLYLHVVDRTEKGIIVRGAKAHNTNAPYAHELIVLPTREMTEADAAYAVAFAIPADTEGITMICRCSSPRQPRPGSRPLSSSYSTVESLTVFDNVFVPWERVFMCGEWQAAGYLAELFATYHRHSYCGCKPAISDVLLGCAALAADYNGVEKATHIRSKLVELIAAAEIVHACGIASSVNGRAMPSGTYLPDVVYSNIGKYYSGTTLHHEFELVHDIAGGLVVTMPPEEDFEQSPTAEYLDKYLRGRAEVTTADRIRCFRLIEDITASAAGGLLLVAGVHGGGSPEAERITILRQYDVAARKALAKRLAGIEG